MKLMMLLIVLVAACGADADTNPVDADLDAPDSDPQAPDAAVDPDADADAVMGGIDAPPAPSVCDGKWGFFLNRLETGCSTANQTHLFNVVGGAIAGNNQYTHGQSTLRIHYDALSDRCIASGHFPSSVGGDSVRTYLHVERDATTFAIAYGFAASHFTADGCSTSYVAQGM